MEEKVRGKKEGDEEVRKQRQERQLNGGQLKQEGNKKEKEE